MFSYSQTSGILKNADGTVIGRGYSGHGRGLDDPAFADQHNIGPIPQGKWIIGRFFDDFGGKGPIVCHLLPQDGTEAYGRSGFMIHGDNHEQNYSASHGCIILSREGREKIAASYDGVLEVVR
jgi:Protein of unknown function (DUF2778)